MAPFGRQPSAGRRQETRSDISNYERLIRLPGAAGGREEHIHTHFKYFNTRRNEETSADVTGK